VPIFLFFFPQSLGNQAFASFCFSFFSLRALDRSTLVLVWLLAAQYSLTLLLFLWVYGDFFAFLLV